MCSVLILVPLVTESKDSLIGCAMLISGVIPYFLWGNQKYLPGFLKSFADSIKLCTGEIFKIHFRFNRKVVFKSCGHISESEAPCSCPSLENSGIFISVKKLRLLKIQIFKILAINFLNEIGIWNSKLI